MTAHLGEIISLLVAVSWTATALFADEASHRLGSLTVNVIRLVLGSVFLALILWFTIGAPYPKYADGATWFWLALSALVGYLFGDYCLFNSYLIIGARFGQLFMTLAPYLTGSICKKWKNSQKWWKDLQNLNSAFFQITLSC